MTKAQAALIVAKRLHDTSPDHLSKVKTDLDTVMHKILSKSETWGFMEREASFPTVADQADYSIATDLGASNIRRILSLRIDGQRRPLDPKPIETYERQFAHLSSGLPRIYAQFAGRLWLGPRPGQIYTIETRYYLEQVDLTDTESPPWPHEFNEIWMKGAESIGLRYNDDVRAAALWREFGQDISDMKGDDPVIDEEIRCTPFTAGLQPIIDPYTGEAHV